MRASSRLLTLVPPAALALATALGCQTPEPPYLPDDPVPSASAEAPTSAASGPGDRGPAAAPARPAGPTPIADGAIFSSEITNPYLPLSIMRYTELESPEEWVVRAVTKRTEILGGVECLELAEQEYDGGQLAETSFNYFAQDEQGNVWYFGERVDEYDDGQVVAHGGSWLVGRDVAEPSLIMPAKPRVGLAFKPENFPPEAEEFDEIEAVDATLDLPSGSFRDVLVIKEGDRPGEWTERKYYAPGVGLVSENRTLNLTVSQEAAPLGQ